jgi:hypothetical protein
MHAGKCGAFAICGSGAQSFSAEHFLSARVTTDKLDLPFWSCLALSQKESMVFLARALAHTCLTPPTDQSKVELGTCQVHAAAFVVVYGKRHIVKRVILV